MLRLSITLLLCCLFSSQAESASCLYLNSYHRGYEWSDRIQDGITQALKSECRMTYFYLNAKHEKNPDRLRQKGEEAANLISVMHPDLVIAADDAASEYVVVPFLRNNPIPVVFVGINWDPRPLGYPMDNATGMVERWPIDQVYKLLRAIVPGLSTITFISSDNVGEYEYSDYFLKAARETDIQLRTALVSTFKEWKQAIDEAQSSDAILLGTNQGIDGWNQQQAIDRVKTHNRRLTVSSQDFMLPYSILTVSKEPAEFSQWVADVCRTLLNGEKPWQIPIIPNRQFTLRYNGDLLSAAGILLPANIRRQARRAEVAP